MIKLFVRFNRFLGGLAISLLLTVGISSSQAQDRVFPPAEPAFQTIGVHLTPLDKIEALQQEGFNLLSVSAASNNTISQTKSNSTPKSASKSDTSKVTRKATSKVTGPSQALVPAPSEVTPPQTTSQTLPPQPAPTLAPVTQDIEPRQQPALAPTGNTSKPVSNKGLKNWIQKQTQAITYAPLEAIVIFPVIKHGQEKAFGDLPLIFSREYALALESKVQKTKVYHPVYTVDELRMMGLGQVYDQIMGYYIKAGRPEPKATDYMLKRLSNDGKVIARVIFVEADLDMSHVSEKSGVFERINGWMTDALPKQMKYFINSRLQVFDAENPEFPMIWGGSWRRSIKTNQFGNVTASVFADSDSQQSLAQLSREMSRELLWIMPKSAYMAPQYDLSVQGKLTSTKESGSQNMTAASSPAHSQINTVHKQAIQRILQRSNSVNP